MVDWVKEETHIKSVSLVLIRGSWESEVVPRRDLWKVGRGSHNFGFDFIEFEVFSR